MKKIISILIIILIWTTNSLSYEVNVHQKITNKAITNSSIGNYLKNKLNILLNSTYGNKTIQEWIEEGSKLEDDDLTMRWLNHFYDPTTEKGLNTGGIIIWGEPSLQWGKNSTNSWDWENARNYYYSALRSINRDSRESAFANTFRALGQVIHLIQDIAVPAHTRNDAHNFSKKQLDMYEMYTKKDDVIKVLKYDGYPAINNATFNNFDSFWKNNGKGLAEYTNRNFLSRNTNIDDNVYAFPVGTGMWTATETVNDVDLGWINVEVKYLKGYASDSYRPDLSAPVNRLSAYSYFDYEMNKYNSTQKVYSLNNFIHKEYSDFLIPRAVGYSAGLLDYFFRGKLNIIQIGRDTFKIVNASDEDTEGNLGSFKLFYDDINDNRYEMPLAFFNSSGNQYTDPATVLSIPKQTTGSFAVKLLSPPANLGNTGEYMLVFKGRIGNEGVAPYDTQYAIAAYLITPHFLTQVKIEGWTDIYEYDQSGNRLANLTENLPRGEAYYNGIPNPVNSDLVLFHKNSGCFLGMNCLHMLNRSTGEVTNFDKYGTYWWSKDGTRIYKHGEYYDLPTGTWHAFDAGWCSVFVNHFGSFSPDESKTAFEGNYYDNSTGYNYQDIVIMTNWQPSHIIDMNTRRVVSVNEATCPDYVRDEGFNDNKPDFHPSQEKILFTSNADGSFDAAFGDRVPYNIYVADKGTGEVQRLTDAPAGSMGYSQAVWSFDGKQILMIGGDPSEIYIMPSEGGTPEKITDEGLEHYYPKWTRLMP